jgi:hypothetical protein
MNCACVWSKGLVVLTITGITMGCLRIPSATQMRFTRQEPTRTNIVGTWVPDKATLTDMRSRGKYSPGKVTELVLNQDGSFAATNLPDWLDLPFGHSGGNFFSDSGEWKIAQDGRFWVLELYSARDRMRLNLVEQQPPYRLYVPLGDPDSGQAMTFVKSEP